MIQEEVLWLILQEQKRSILAKDNNLRREKFSSISLINTYASIVSGIRRCGKSTLLYQLLTERYPEALYINFDDPRLCDLEIADFYKIDKLIKEVNTQVLMFDEIQIIKGWERYVRQKLDEGFQIFVTGSNASLLSKELGTSLTGRHLTTELFPFSYNEFLAFNKLDNKDESVLAYLQKGGFPEYLKTGFSETLTTLVDDILVRDIAVRYNVRDVRTLQRLCFYLLNNVGNYVSANRLKSVFGISSATTILEYFSHLEQTYLIHFVPLFDYSLKKQNSNPKKIYAIDSGLVEVCTPNFKMDVGHKFENLIYLNLRRRSKEIYYYKHKGECDFLVLENGIINEAIQVCYELNSDNLDRELNGLYEAMTDFNLRKGTVVTLSQSDVFSKDGMQIDVIPATAFLISNNT